MLVTAAGWEEAALSFLGRAARLPSPFPLFCPQPWAWLLLASAPIELVVLEAVVAGGGDAWEPSLDSQGQEESLQELSPRLADHGGSSKGSWEVRQSQQLKRGSSSS